MDRPLRLIPTSQTPAAELARTVEALLVVAAQPLTPAQPPPPNVPSLKDDASTKAMTMRQRMEQHRANPTCAVCHKMMDPLGFSLVDGDIDVVRVTQRLLFAALLALKEPGFGMLDASHRLHDIQADDSASILNQRLVVEKGFRFDGKLAAQLFE